MTPVAAYFAAVPPKSRQALKRLRAAIKSAAPSAKEAFSYGIPAFKIDGRPLVWFAAFRDHSSFFPGATAIRKHAMLLGKYKISKGTIQFPPDDPLPASLVAKLVKTRI